MRKEKQFLLDEVSDGIQSAKAMVFTQYETLRANDLAAIRKSLYQIGSDLHIVRKRVLVKAAAQNGITLNEKSLKGHVGVVFANEDPVACFKAVCNAAKEHNSKVVVLGGYLDQKLCSASDVEKISKLPSMPEMRAQFLGMLEAPMAQTLAVFDALLTSVIHCVNNRCEKLEEQEPA
jgi:large subunit ribosomal protein L10